MDAVALSAIRTAAPFARLPEGYAATTLDLQFSFYYNSEPREPAQKPKVVPVGTALITTRAYAATIGFRKVHQPEFGCTR
jgi:hypothetical protein